MPNVLADCAQAVADALNNAIAGTFSKEFEAVRSYADWELPLEENQGGNLMVDVVPNSQLTTDVETHGSLKYGPAVDVVVRLGLGPERRKASGRFNIEEIDELALFVLEIAQYFAISRFGDSDQFSFDAEVGTKILAAYMPSHLRQNHQFTGIVRIPFRCSVILG
jgi:hypothetical protein